MKSGCLAGINFPPNDSGDFSRDFWIGQPIISASEICFPNQPPCVLVLCEKMMTILLFLAGYKEDHGVRPRSLKVTTIFTLMGEIAKGNANSSHLAIQ